MAEWRSNAHEYEPIPKCAAHGVGGFCPRCASDTMPELAIVPRALLREAADALERLHHSSYDGPGCSDCDLIRRLREAAK